MRRLLLVDDERPLVEGLKKVLRPWRDRWQVQTAVGGMAAIESMRTERFDAIVSDARMPDVDGEAVLKAAVELQPEAARLVLSGQTDAQTGRRLALVSHQFLTKPAGPEALMAAVEECCLFRESIARLTAGKTVGALESLCSGPEVYRRLAASTSGTDVVMQVIDAFRPFPQIADSALAIANTPEFGLPVSVNTIQALAEHAGLERVREATLIAEVFTRTPGELMFARRAVFRSQVARLLTHGEPVSHLACEAALLIDLGILALWSSHPDRYAALWERSLKGEGALHELEHAAFGIAHPELGALLLAKWSMPGPLMTSVQWCRSRPPPGAVLDARTATALTAMLECEALYKHTPEHANRLAEQLDVAGRLAVARSFMAKWAAFELLPMIRNASA
jgi:DNA-binding NarL/FixJ family response regulator